MSLTRTIKIEHCVFTADTLDKLLTALSAYYEEPVAGSGFRHRYQLDISEDGFGTASIDTPPKSFQSLLEAHISSVELKIDCPGVGRELLASIKHASGFGSIKLTANDQEWVNRTHDSLSRILDTVTPQPSTSSDGVLLCLTILTSVLVAWPLAHLFIILFIGRKYGPEMWNEPVTFPRLLFVVAVSVVVFKFLQPLLEAAYPTVEIQTGPKHKWKTARLRWRLKWVVGLLIVGPSANFLYDVYKEIAK